MSIIASVLALGAGRLSKTKTLLKFPWLAKSVAVTGTVGLMGVQAFHGYGYSSEYGGGSTLLFGIAARSPMLNIAITTLEHSKGLLDKNYHHQHQRTRSSFATKHNVDKFGTILKARQFAAQQMRRDHTSVQRLFNNEAFYLHR